jgi:hypothetical protein
VWHLCMVVCRRKTWSLTESTVLVSQEYCLHLETMEAKHLQHHDLCTLLAKHRCRIFEPDRHVYQGWKSSLWDLERTPPTDDNRQFVLGSLWNSLTQWFSPRIAIPVIAIPCQPMMRTKHSHQGNSHLPCCFASC